MKRTIFLKTFWGYLLIIMLVLLFIVMFSFNSIESWHMKRITRDLFRTGQAMKPGIQRVLKDEPLRLDTFVKNLGKMTGVRITVIQADGNVLADSISDPAAMENHGDRPEIRKALQGDPTDNLRFSTTLMSSMLYMAMPLRTGDSITGVVRVSLFVEDIHLLTNDIEKQIVTAALVLTLISLIFTFFVSRSISNPVKRLAAAARQVAVGDYDVNVFPRGGGELEELARSFNEMVTRLKGTMDNLKRSREELETIIGSIREGLLVLDGEGKIILTNDYFKDIIGDNHPEGKNYWEVFRSTELFQLIREVMQSGEDLTGEVELGGHTLEAGFSVLSSGQTLVATFHDITERQRLEAIKRDFVVNVSHELKTPLTSIKGFVEVLEDGIKGENRRYLDIIGRNTERLSNIVQDLLLLAKLEEKPFITEPMAVDLKDLLEKIVKLFEPQLKEKELYLKIEAADELPPVKGDIFKLEDLLVNLIDNAVKYTERGGIIIRLLVDKAQLRLEVEDTGIGIAGEHVERIFERFYVVDSSRSKSGGGTGLGLSIVKHIVLLHQGKINIDSVPRQGTTFTVWLPQFEK